MPCRCCRGDLGERHIWVLRVVSLYLRVADLGSWPLVTRGVASHWSGSVVMWLMRFWGGVKKGCLRRVDLRLCYHLRRYVSKYWCFCDGAVFGWLIGVGVVACSWFVYFCLLLLVFFILGCHCCLGSVWSSWHCVSMDMLPWHVCYVMPLHYLRPIFCFDFMLLRALVGWFGAGVLTFCFFICSCRSVFSLVFVVYCLLAMFPGFLVRWIRWFWSSIADVGSVTCSPLICDWLFFRGKCMLKSHTEVSRRSLFCVDDFLV